jgi:hypothetical protein
MGKRKKSRRPLKSSHCYLCGEWCEKPTADHVPPWCLSPDTPQSQFIKAPACQRCNNLYQEKESRFRDYAIFITHQRGSDSAKAAQAKFLRSISRNADGRAGRTHKDLQRLQDSYIELLHVDTQGRLFAHSTHMTTAQDDFYEFEIFLKIARGIHYYHSRTVVPIGHHVYIYRIDSGKFLHMVENRSHLYYRQQGNFFAYVGGYDQNQPTDGVWAMNLYGELGVVVSFESKERDETIRRSPFEIPPPADTPSLNN